MSQTQKLVRHGLQMRHRFNCENFRLANWFPKHMFQALLQVQAKLHSIDAVVEVHDARIPITGRNAKLTDIGIAKPSLLVINKFDLIDPSYKEPFEQRFHRMGLDVLFTNSKDSKDEGVSKLVPAVLKLLETCSRYNRAENIEYNIMVIGVPNIGKSSLINALRCHNTQRKKCAPVAPRPGVTRNVMERIRVYRRPEVFMRDTPGVLAPSIPSVESGIKLSLAAVVDDRIVGTRVMADYLLYWLNSRGRHEYVKVLQLEEPTDDIQKLLVTIAVKNNFVRKSRATARGKIFPDFESAALFFITRWREGSFGCGMLDDEQFSPVF